MVDRSQEARHEFRRNVLSNPSRPIRSSGRLPWFPMPHTRDITTGNILASAAAGIVTTLVLASFGATGGMLGAALGPVIFLIVKELTRGPADSVTRRRFVSTAASDAGIPCAQSRTEPAPVTPLRGRRRETTLLATALLAAVLAIGALTLPEIRPVSSPVSERQTTIITASSWQRATPGMRAATLPTPATDPAPTDGSGSSLAQEETRGVPENTTTSQSASPTPPATPTSSAAPPEPAPAPADQPAAQPTVSSDATPGASAPVEPATPAM